MSLLEHCRKFNGDPTFGGLVTAWRTYHVLNEQNKVYNDPYFTAATDYLLDLYKEIVDLNCKHAVGIFVKDDNKASINRLDVLSADIFTKSYTRHKMNVLQLANRNRFAYFGANNANEPSDFNSMAVPINIIDGVTIHATTQGGITRGSTTAYVEGSARNSLLITGIEREVSTHFWARRA